MHACTEWVSAFPTTMADASSYSSVYEDKLNAISLAIEDALVQTAEARANIGKVFCQLEAAQATVTESGLELQRLHDAQRAAVSKSPKLQAKQKPLGMAGKRLNTSTVNEP